MEKSDKEILKKSPKVSNIRLKEKSNNKKQGSKLKGNTFDNHPHLKKSLLLVIVLLLLTILCFGGYKVFINYQEEKKEQERINKEKLVQEITNHYNDSVITTTETKLYQKNKNKYVVMGTISENIELELLPDQKITFNTLYFKLKNIDYYVKYQDVKIIDKLTSTDKQYKRYIPFNQSVVTEKNTKLYVNDKLTYDLNIGITSPIIIKKENEYYIEYDNKLLYLKKDDGIEIKENHNTDEEIASSLAATVYHFIYNPDIDSCNEIICHSTYQVDSHFNYYKENNFFTIRMHDLELFLDGAINLPKKSVLITIDDGARAENIIPLLEKYQFNATLFLITAWFDLAPYNSPYLEIHSHGHDLHNPGVCQGGQGGGIRCLPREQLLKDLSDSRKELNDTTVFCYPFYEYNNYAINILHEAGFTMAFVGGQQRITRETNRMILPRYTLLYDTSVAELAEVVN